MNMHIYGLGATVGILHYEARILNDTGATYPHLHFLA